MKNKSMLSLVLSMFIFGTIGIFRNFLPYSSGQIAFFRGVIGFVFMVAVVIITKKRYDFTAVKRNFLFLSLSGAFIGLNWLLLFEAFRYTTVAKATLCYYMQPIFVVMLSPVIFKEKLTPKKVICTLVAFFGMIPISGVLNREVGKENEHIGILLALAAAVLYSGVVILNKKMSSIGAYEKTTVQLLFSSLILLPFVLFTQSDVSIGFGLGSVLLLICVGVIHTGLAYALYFYSMDGLKSQTIALFSYIDPVVAIILSASILSQPFGVWEIIGSVLILGSAFLSEFEFRRKTNG